PPSLLEHAQRALELHALALGIKIEIVAVSKILIHLKRQAHTLRTLGKAEGKFQLRSFRYLVPGQDFRIHTGRLYCKPLLGHLPTAVHWLPSHVIAHRKRLAQGRNRLYGQGSILTLPQL